MPLWRANCLSLVAQVLACLVYSSSQVPTRPIEEGPYVTTGIATRSKSNTVSELHNDTANYTTLILPYNSGSQYAVEVALNNEPHLLQPDTGSSDTWIILPDFQCITANGTLANQSLCNMGQPYLGSFEAIPGKVFNQSYGNGYSISGAFGYANVTVAGLTIRTQVAFVDRAYYDGNGTVSGLIGLAPGTTRQFTTSSGVNVDGLQVEHYPAFIDLFYADPSVAPTFSVTMQPGPVAGYISFGGLPPLSFEKDFTTVNYTFIEGLQSGVTGQIQYPVQSDGVVVNGKLYNTTFKVVVDTGTYVNRFPRELAEQINAQFDPPAVYEESLGLYITTCNATAPSFGINIGGETFMQRPEDGFAPLIEYDGYCTTSFLPGFLEPSDKHPDGYYCLGDVFLFNVVAAFDGNGTFHFAPRDYTT